MSFRRVCRATNPTYFAAIEGRSKAILSASTTKGAWRPQRGIDTGVLQGFGKGKRSDRPHLYTRLVEPHSRSFPDLRPFRRLKRLRDHHIAKHGDTRSFPVPFSYQPGRKYDLSLSRPPQDPPACDPCAGRSRRLQQAKACLSNWLWLACNAALDRAASRDAQSGPGGQPILTDSRKAAMQCAVRFARAYPLRDQARCLSSPWILCLRNVLKTAPKIPLRHAWGVRVDDLEFFDAPSHRRGHTSGHYEWSGAYIERVLKALRSVFAAHGDRPSVRYCVLWEVYDAVCLSLVTCFAFADRASSIRGRSAVGYAMILSWRRGPTPQRHG